MSDGNTYKNYSRTTLEEDMQVKLDLERSITARLMMKDFVEVLTRGRR